MSLSSAASGITQQLASWRIWMGHIAGERDAIEKASVLVRYHRRQRPHGAGDLPEVFGEAGTRNQVSAHYRADRSTYTANKVGGRRLFGVLAAVSRR